MMSRKDYRAIAEAFRTATSQDEALANVARYLKSDNPRFDRERFFAAATTPKGK